MLLKFGLYRHPAIVLAALLAVAAPAGGSAQSWPTGTVRIIVPFGPGSTPDVVARMMADRLRHRLGTAFVVENKPGASGNLGTDAVAKAEPDGSTLGLSIGGPLAINPLLFSRLPYDPQADLALITVVATQPSALAVNADLAVGSVAELIEALKRKPDGYNFGSIGNGSLSHLAMEAIAIESKTRIVHVPYASSPQAVTALMRGDVQIACLPAISLVSQVASGRIRILAVTTAQRSPLLPQVATLKEAGIDVEANAWMGLIAPAKTADAVIAAIHGDVVEAIRTPEVRDKLAAQLMEPVGNSPAEFKALVQAEVARWMPVIKAARIRIN